MTNSEKRERIIEKLNVSAIEMDDRIISVYRAIGYLNNKPFIVVSLSCNGWNDSSYFPIDSKTKISAMLESLKAEIERFKQL